MVRKKEPTTVPVTDVPSGAALQGVARYPCQWLRPAISADRSRHDVMIDPNQIRARRFGYRGAMVNERFEFLTHAQFDELSQPEKIAYLTRATAALNSLWKLAKADPPSSADAEDAPGNAES